MAEGAGRKPRKPWNLKEDDIVRKNSMLFKSFGLTQQDAVKVIRIFIDIIITYLSDENMPNELTIDLTGLCKFKYKRKDGLKKGHKQKVMNWETNESYDKVWEEDDPDYRILKCDLNTTLYNNIKDSTRGKV